MDSVLLLIDGKKVIRFQIKRKQRDEKGKRGGGEGIRPISRSHADLRQRTIKKHDAKEGDRR